MLWACVVLCLAVSTSTLQYGDGVCNRTVIRNETKTVQEVIVRTEIVPCTINSWIDALSCMQRNYNITRNVLETITKTIIVPRLVTILICCDGYSLVNDKCLLHTTAIKATTERLTRPPTKERTLTQPKTDVISSTQRKRTAPTKITTATETTNGIPTTEMTTVTHATKTTPEKKSKSSEITLTETTTKDIETTEITTATRATKTNPEKTTKSTKSTLTETKTKDIETTEITTTTQATIPTKTTSNDIETSEIQTTQTTANKITPALETVVIKNIISSKPIPSISTTEDVTPDRGIILFSDDGPKQSINKKNDNVGTNNNGEDPKKKTSSEDHDIKDILLYVLIVCLAISIIITVTVVWVCRRKSRKSKKSANGTTVFTMNIIAENTTSPRGAHGSNTCIQLRQNEQNIYTELSYYDDNHYDELGGAEDPYDELPDYDDCNASPKLTVFRSETNKATYM